MNVLSLFDGMSCGQIALNKAGIKYHNYFACEIDKYAIQVAQENFPNTVQLGDVTKVWTSKSFSQGKEIGVLVAPCRGHHKIDLLMGGSPCQGFSFAGKQLNFEDPRSKLFFEFVRLKDNLQPKYFLLENVKMKKESEDIITKYLGVKPIEINSSLFSAQSRRRLYWTNIPFDKQIQDKGIVLKDILEDLPFSEIPNYLNNKWCGRRRGDMVKSVTDDKAHCLTASMWKGQIPTFVKKPIQVGEATNIKGFDSIKRVYSPNGKSPTLTTMQGGHREPKVAIDSSIVSLNDNQLEKIRKINTTPNKANCLTEAIGRGGSSSEFLTSVKKKTLALQEKEPKIGRVINRRLDENGVRKDGQKELPFTPQIEISDTDKSNCLTTVQKDNVVVQDELYRKLTPLECERLQTVPDNYTNHVSKTQRYKMLGNGWTVDVVAHIFGGMNE
jgi:DNA (cytosine-5)-methyltransferase 3A